LTDWWNAFFVLPHNRSVNVVFLDAHPEGNLDSVWSDLFGSVTFAKHLPAGGVCFEQAILIPPGYLCPLFPSAINIKKKCPAMVRAFADFILKRYGLEDVQLQQGSVVIIDRSFYIAHPRSKKVDRKLNNLPVLRDRILNEANVTSVQLVRLEQLTFKEQLRLMREKAHILIGNHGAGLSFTLFLQDGASVGELNAHHNQMITSLSGWVPTRIHRPLSYSKRQISEKSINEEIIPLINEALLRMPTPAK